MPTLIPQVLGSSGTHVVSLTRDELLTVVNAIQRIMRSQGPDGPTKSERRLYLQLIEIAQRIGMQSDAFGYWREPNHD